jgi:creatinine amidohydrolase
MFVTKLFLKPWELPFGFQLNERGLQVDYFDLLGPLCNFEDEIAEQECGTHTDEIETSMMLYIAPEIVKMEKAVDEIHPKTPGPFTRDPIKVVAFIL